LKKKIALLEETSFDQMYSNIFPEGVQYLKTVSNIYYERLIDELQQFHVSIIGYNTFF